MYPPPISLVSPSLPLCLSSLLLLYPHFNILITITIKTNEEIITKINEETIIIILNEQTIITIKINEETITAMRIEKKRISSVPESIGVVIKVE